MLTGLIVGLLALAVSTIGAFLRLDRPTMDNSACHAAPGKPYTPADAHVVWQVRAACDSRICADKAAALDVLIDARKSVPTREYR